MSYHFSPATDSDQLQAALSALYGEQAMADQLARYQKALAGLEAAFGLLQPGGAVFCPRPYGDRR